MTFLEKAGAVDEAGTTQRRNTFQLLADPLFGTVFWGKLAVGIGVWVHNVVAAILVFHITGSALWVGS